MFDWKEKRKGERKVKAAENGEEMKEQSIIRMHLQKYYPNE